MDVCVRVCVCGRVPSHVLWVVLQTGDELSHISALEADLIDCRKQRKPAEESRHKGSVLNEETVNWVKRTDRFSERQLITKHRCFHFCLITSLPRSEVCQLLMTPNSDSRENNKAV